VVEQQHLEAELAGPRRTEEAGSTGADDDGVEAGGRAQVASAGAAGVGVYIRWPTTGRISLST